MATDYDAPVMEKIDNIPKKLDSILEQLTILSGIKASASRAQKADARDTSYRKLNRSATRSQEATNEHIKEMNRSMERLVKMQEAQAKMVKSQENRTKRESKDITRKSRESREAKLRTDALKEQKKAYKEMAKNQKKRGGSGNFGKGLMDDLELSNLFYAFGPLGMVSKILFQDTKTGRLLKDKSLDFLKSKKSKMSGSGVKNLFGVSKGGKALPPPQSGGGVKALPNKGVAQKQAQIADTSKRTGKPTDQQIRKSIVGRPIMWLSNKMDKMSGSKGKDLGGGKKLFEKGSKGLLDFVLPVLGGALGLGVGTIKGIVKGFKGGGTTPKGGKTGTPKGGKITNTGKGGKTTNTGKGGKTTPKGGTPKGGKGAVTTRTTGKATNSIIPKGGGKGFLSKMGKGVKGVASLGLFPALTALQGGSAEDVAEATAVSLAYNAGSRLAERGVSKLVEKGIMGVGAKTVLGGVGSVLSGVGWGMVAYEGINTLVDLYEESQKSKQRKFEETHEIIDGLGGTTIRELTDRELYNNQVHTLLYDMTKFFKEKGQEVPKELGTMLQKAENNWNNFSNPLKALDDKEFDIFSTILLPRLIKNAEENDSHRDIKRVLKSTGDKLVPADRDRRFNENYHRERHSKIGYGPLPAPGSYDSQKWYRETIASSRAFSRANETASQPESADDYLSSPRGNVSFNPRDRHYVLPGGQVLSTNRELNTLPESNAIQSNRFSGLDTESNGNTNELLQQILKALQKDGANNVVAVNNSNKIVNMENFVSGGLFV